MPQSIQGGSRRSLGPPQRPTAGPRTDSMANRPSLNSSSLSLGRTLGVGASLNPGRGKMSDSRPLKDREYMNAQTRKLLDFLVSSNYPHPIAPKAMVNPSSKEFLSILTFLIMLLDPHYLPLKKIEDEIPSTFKQFGYPWMITKTNLIAPGAPNTWPNLLGAASFVVDLLIYDQERQIEGSSAYEGDNERKDTMFVNEKLASGYITWMTGNDDITCHDTSVVTYFHQRNEEIKNSIGQLQETLNQQEQQLLTFGGNEYSLPSLEVKLHERNETLKAKQHENESQASVLKHWEEKIRDKNNIIQEQLNEKLPLQNELEKLKHQLDSQEISREELQRMLTDRQTLQNELERLRGEKDNLNSRLWDLKDKSGSYEEILHKLARQISQDAAKLGKIPKSRTDTERGSIDLPKIDLTARKNIKQLLGGNMEVTIDALEAQLKTGEEALQKAKDEEEWKYGSEISMLETQQKQLIESIEWKTKRESAMKNEDALTQERFNKQLSEMRTHLEEAEKGTEKNLAFFEAWLKKENQSQLELVLQEEESRLLIESERQQADKIVAQVSDIVLKCQRKNNERIHHSEVAMQSYVDQLQSNPLRLPAAPLTVLQSLHTIN
eukprot:GHVL01031580.1.p1 GENE.GHVL01031580.1~~GHVL01031580.1.p1  ORF type:complete len:629 (+),score=96.92 GHVL01031580.1:64-1887(+)